MKAIAQSALLASLFALMACHGKDARDKPETGAQGMDGAPEAASPAAARKETPGPGFKLPCGKDSAVVLKDDTAEGGGFVKHILIDSLVSADGYFVERAFYEGSDWIFVEKKYCRTTDLFGPVVFNPSRRAFASVSNDNEAGFSENGVQLVSLSHGSPTVDLQDRLDRYAGERWTWIDDSTFVMDIKDMQGSEKKRWYELREGTWQIRNE